MVQARARERIAARGRKGEQQEVVTGKGFGDAVVGCKVRIAFDNQGFRGRIKAELLCVVGGDSTEQQRPEQQQARPVE